MRVECFGGPWDGEELTIDMDRTKGILMVPYSEAAEQTIMLPGSLDPVGVYEWNRAMRKMEWKGWK